ncbi:hypothetical protein H0H87_012984, partial [Tephrocybe sp. NHM501043]
MIRTRASQRRRKLPPKPFIKRDIAPPKKIIPPYHEFTCWSSLLDLFHIRIASFLRAHEYYQRFKQTSQPTGPAHFKFEGEYSVVALDFDVHGRKTEVHFHAMRLKDDLGRVGSLVF